MADRHPDGPAGRLGQRIGVDRATVGRIEHQQRLTVLAVAHNGVGDVGTRPARRGQRGDVVAGPHHVTAVTGILDGDELGARAAAGDDQAVRRHRRRGLRQIVQRHRPFRFAVAGVERPQSFVAPVDIDRRAVRRQHRAGQRSAADRVACPLPGQKRTLPGPITQPDKDRGLGVGFPQPEHHQPGRCCERRCGGHRAAGTGQSAIGEAAVGVGRVDTDDQVQRRADDGALVGVEHEDLTEVRHHQQVARVENPWGGGHSDHRSAPPDPLRRREGQHRAGLADVEVVEPVETAGWTSRRPVPAACTSAGGRCCRPPTPSASNRRGFAR